MDEILSGGTWGCEERRRESLRSGTSSEVLERIEGARGGDGDPPLGKGGEFRSGEESSLRGVGRCRLKSVTEGGVKVIGGARENGTYCSRLGSDVDPDIDVDDAGLYSGWC